MSSNWKDPISRPNERIYTSNASQNISLMLSTTTCAPVPVCEVNFSRWQSDTRFNWPEQVSFWPGSGSVMQWFSSIDISANGCGSTCARSEEIRGSTIFACGSGVEICPWRRLVNQYYYWNPIWSATITTANLTNTRLVWMLYFKWYNSKSDAQT